MFRFSHNPYCCSYTLFPFQKRLGTFSNNSTKFGIIDSVGKQMLSNDLTNVLSKFTDNLKDIKQMSAGCV